ncbi:hypothetical protein EYF80_032162 [Liparis tanakae]|uniref:Uncharacterized protein n=1 Tax=Liparis tanakae TaxID=230148 RepID=A0A4Z2GYA0_9TELE|nr:hypothetical protein EYF80_032162 [Liparis tanakae]
MKSSAFSGSSCSLSEDSDSGVRNTVYYSAAQTTPEAPLTSEARLLLLLLAAFCLMTLCSTDRKWFVQVLRRASAASPDTRGSVGVKNPDTLLSTGPSSHTLQEGLRSAPTSGGRLVSEIKITSPIKGNVPPRGRYKAL